MDYVQLLYPFTSTLMKYLEDLKKQKKNIVMVKELRADPEINSTNKIMVQIKLNDDEEDTPEKIKQVINESGKAHGAVQTVGPYRYVEKK